MYKDEIVEEVRAARDAYARQFNYDIDAMIKDIQSRQATSGHPVVTLPPKRITPTEKSPKPEQVA